MAVAGAGLTGLAAAWDLSRKGYPVTVFHTDAPESALLAAYPVLASAGLDKDFLAEDMALLTRQKVRFELATLDAALATRLAEEFDGVLLDADAAPDLAPAQTDVDAETLLWRDNLCCAGWKNRTPTATPTLHLQPRPDKAAGRRRPWIAW